MVSAAFNAPVHGMRQALASFGLDLTTCSRNALLYCLVSLRRARKRDARAAAEKQEHQAPAWVKTDDACVLYGQLTVRQRLHQLAVVENGFLAPACARARANESLTHMQCDP